MSTTRYQFCLRMHNQPVFARLRALICFAFIGLSATFIGTASAQSAEEPKVDWVAYIDSIAKEDPSSWIERAHAGHLSTEYDSSSQVAYGFSESTVQLTSEDWAAYLAGRGEGRIEWEAAKRIFQQEELPLPQDGSDSLAIQVLNLTKGASKLDVVLINPADFQWESTVHFLGNGCYLGQSTFFHKYGVSGGGGTVSGIPVVWHIANLGSGTGIWEFEWQVYGLIDRQVVQLGWVPQEVNLTNPCVFNRHLNSKILKTAPLTIRYDWDVDLGYRYRGNSPAMKGNAVVRYDWDAATGRLIPVFLSGNLNAEKMLALSLGAPNELLVHAFAPELKALLRKKGRAKDEAIEFLKEARAEDEVY